VPFFSSAGRLPLILQMLGPLSTREQETQLQIEALSAPRVEVIYREKASNVVARPKLQSCMNPYCQVMCSWSTSWIVLRDQCRIC